MSKLVKATLIILMSLIFTISLVPTKPALAADVEAADVEAAKVEPRAVTSLQSGKVYKIRNKDTGKFLNVNYGIDANGTNVNQFTEDGSIEQKWRAVQNSDGSWKLYTMCSSNGYNRVLDVYRNSDGNYGTGSNIDIWAPNDPEVQNWTLAYQSHTGAFLIWLTSSDYRVLVASYGSGNGGGSGTSSTSEGNVFLHNGAYNPNVHMYWEFIEV